jgi:glycosyl-4,4'-diaponeurosporenoate acyltransferase
MLIHLPGLLNIVIDFVAWLFIHVSVSLWIDKIPPQKFNPETWIYRERRWENGGRIYQVLFKIHKWKMYLPDGAALTKNKFKKKHLVNPDAAYIQRFILETCRAELIHWGILISSLLFFLWNEWWIGLIMVAYGIGVNFPCIVTQRYNRIRLERISGLYNQKSLKKASGTILNSSLKYNDN